MKAIGFLIVFIMSIVVEGGSVSHAAQAPALRKLTEADAAMWRRLDSARLSPDGHRLVYLSRPDPRTSGDTVVVVRDVQGDAERRYLAGTNISGTENVRLQLSPSGRWAAFLSE